MAQLLVLIICIEITENTEIWKVAPGFKTVSHINIYTETSGDNKQRTENCFQNWQIAKLPVLVLVSFNFRIKAVLKLVSKLVGKTVQF